MSDGASAAQTTAPAAPTAAEPAAVARATPTVGVGTPAKKTNIDPFDAARRDAKKRMAERKLKLVENPSEDQTNRHTGTPEESTDADRSSSESTDTDDVDGTAEDGSPEKEPSWAQKLRGDLEKKTTEVKTFTEREAKWGEAVRQTTHRIEDISSERDHYKGLFEQTSKHLIDQGLLDPLSVQFVMEQFKAHGLERQLKRGTSAQTEASKGDLMARHTQAIDGGVKGLIAKFPELDWKKNKDATGFMRNLVKSYGEGGFPANLEAEARRWVLGWRAEQAQKNQQATARPQTQARPESSTLARTANSGRAPVQQERGLREAKTKKQLIAETLQRRAARMTQR